MNKTQTTTRIVGPHSNWDSANNKRITIKVATWRRLQKYFTHYGSTFDSVITQILDEKENKNKNKETPEQERSF